MIIPSSAGVCAHCGMCLCVPVCVCVSILLLPALLGEMILRMLRNEVAHNANRREMADPHSSSTTTTTTTAKNDSNYTPGSVNSTSSANTRGGASDEVCINIINWENDKIDGYIYREIER